MNKPILKIGIDPGVNTGFATLDSGNRQLTLRTLKLHQGFEAIKILNETYDIDVVIENPNLLKRFNLVKNASAKLQGAGSVKRDYSAWTDFFDDHGIRYQAAKPDKQRNALAKNKETFKQITGYNERSSHHARVAAMLIFKKESKSNKFNTYGNQ
jgi:hypothetical protein